MDITNCTDVRRECFALNKTIIQHPLKDQIEQLKHKYAESLARQEKEYEIIWKALKHHTHSSLQDNDKDKVIITAQ